MNKSDILKFVWKPEKTEGGISARERERRDFICRAYHEGTKKFVDLMNISQKNLRNLKKQIFLSIEK